MVLKELYRNFLVQLQGIYSLSEATTIANWVFEVFKTTEKSPVGKRGYRNSRLVPIKDRKLVEQFADTNVSIFLRIAEDFNPVVTIPMQSVERCFNRFRAHPIVHGKFH